MRLLGSLTSRLQWDSQENFVPVGCISCNELPLYNFALRAQRFVAIVAS